MARRQLDATGRPCPVPILELAKLARSCPPGTVIELTATDPAVGPDLESWCASTGHRLLVIREAGGVIRAEVELAGE
jgi:tRNA 2-thiouridine synthesizing protein A